jgi:hypothetical protein
VLAAQRLIVRMPIGNPIEGNLVLACAKDLNISAQREHFEDMKMGASSERADASGLLVDPAGLNFHLLPQGVVLMARQFGRPVPIRVDRIGLLVDEYRRKLPTAEETGRFQNRPPR